MRIIVVLILFSNLYRYATTQITCVTPNNEEALCKQLIHCPHFLQAITPYISEDQKRFLRESQCGYTDKPWVCCGSVANYVNLTSPELQFPPYGITASLNDEPSQSVPVDELKNHKHAVLLRGECGGRIISGPNLPQDDEGDVSLAHALWTALIQYKKEDNSSAFYCGGTVINNNYVITAAHCLTGKIVEQKGKPFLVRVGDRVPFVNPVCRGVICDTRVAIDFDIQQILLHPDYNKTGHNEHDIALIRIKQDDPDIFFSDLDPICFPLLERRTQSVRSSHFALGWGITQNKPEGWKRRLYSLVREISPEHCVSSLKHHLSDHQFCVVKKPKAQHNCVADDGGSIIGLNLDSRSERYFLEGIVNSRKCEDPDFPEVYTRVWPYGKWILDNIKE